VRNLNNIDKLFKSKTKEVTFLELKNQAVVDINGYKLKGGLPLPVITDNLIKDIQYSDLSEEIKLGQIIEGIIFLLGVDPEFPHMDQYKEILFKYDSKILDFIFYRGMKALEAGEYENSGVFFRAVIELDPNNLNARLNYALVLESIGKNLIESEKFDEGKEFLIGSTNEMEDIINIDDSYSLAYYKLGYHYKYFDQYLKAKITWNKFLILDKDENRLQEIREQIDLIEDDVKMEVGLSYLDYNYFDKALDSFLKLMPKYKDNWNINYLIGLCFKGMKDYELAIDYFNNAIELNDEEADIYNELGIIYFVQGNILDAVNIFDKGIKKINDDYKLYFNRGLGYMQLGDNKLALKDIIKANELNPYDENVAMQKEELEKLLKNS
jgi:tetratricopeptide (TPR) repeat protein